GRSGCSRRRDRSRGRHAMGVSHLLFLFCVNHAVPMPPSAEAVDDPGRTMRSVVCRTNRLSFRKGPEVVSDGPQGKGAGSLQGYPAISEENRGGNRDLLLHDGMGLWERRSAQTNKHCRIFGSAADTYHFICKSKTPNRK